MKLRTRRGATSREFRARFKEEARGEVHLVADEWVTPRTMRPFVISPIEARLYVLLEATRQEQERASKLGFCFVPFEPSIIVMDRTGTERVGEIHVWAKGGALFVDGARVTPAEAMRYQFRAITSDQRKELKAFVYRLPGPG